MFSSQQQLLLGFLAALLCLQWAKASEEATAMPQLDVIKEDVIRDVVENKTQKVIRVNPLDLPSKKDHKGNNMNSELFQIQTLRPGVRRKYLDSKRMRRPRPAAETGEEVPVLKYTKSALKPFPKQKMKKQKQLQLPFLLEQPKSQSQNQPRLNSDADSLVAESSQMLPVQVAPGDYPIYYVMSKTNGRFGKFPIKAFRTQSQFIKYLLKSKAEPITLAQRYELTASR